MSGSRETRDLGDTRLWSKAREGEPEARESLFLRIREVADGELRQRGVSKGEREALVQTTIESVLAFMARGGELSQNLQAFARYRAWGVLSDYRKKLRSAASVLSAESAPEPMSKDPEPDATLIGAELELVLRRCCRRLPEAQRRVAELRYLEEMTPSEIAARLGITPGAVHLRSFRALQSLRACLESKGFGPGGRS